MWDVANVGYSGYVGCLECGMFAEMWDVGLQNGRPFQERRAIARARTHTRAKVLRRVINRTRK